jgi:1A family penicillin-binding protein
MVIVRESGQAKGVFAMSTSKDPKTRAAARRRGINRLQLLKRLFTALVALCVLGAASITAFFFYIGTRTLPAVQVQQTSLILDANGEEIEAIHAGQHREIVRLSDISEHLIDAVVAIEDRRFYDHFGIDLYGTARAVWVNLRNMAKVQGASTITQQLARNLYLNHERTWDRKLKEAVYALQLEMNFSKREILELYLNTIYFGHSLYGVETAARAYFGKSAKELSLAESALLAGVPKGALYYSPYYNPENAKKRQKAVLQAMVETGAITQAEADAAFAEPLDYKPLANERVSKAPYFADYVKQKAVHELGLDEDLLYGGGVRIYTTLDLRMQQAAEKAIADHLQNDPDLQAALVAIDPRTGYVKAMVGGRDYKSNQYNRVFSKNRQPGSSFKPILYLTALMQEGFTPIKRYRSEPTSFIYDEGRETYTPSNYGERYANEEITLREAIAQSDNIYAVHTIMDIGADKVIETARLLGIESPLEPLPSLALGTFPVSPFEMAAAYGVIANQGVSVPPTAILRIEDAKGRVLYEADPQPKRVIDPAYPYVLTKLMESVFEPGGTASRVARTLKRPVAGKTGTTNQDAWMVGFTPELSTAVWIGYDRGKTISSVQASRAAPIFAQFIEEVLEHVPPKLFEVPPGVVSLYIDPDSGTIATPRCGKQARLEYFVKGTEPQTFCSELDGNAGGAADRDELLKQHEQESMQRERQSWWDHLKRWWWRD